MFDVDKLITETNKEMLYGKKPKLPERLNIDFRSAGNCETLINGKVMPEDQIEEIAETVNKIIEYLKWEEL